MKKITLLLLVVGCLGIYNYSFGQYKHQPTIDCDKLIKNPEPHYAVVDNANIIDDTYQNALESQLRAYWVHDSIAICVVTIPTLGNYDGFDYSFSLANCWGIGGKDDRGLLIFIGLEENAIEIRTGDGIDFCITDVESNDLIYEMKPYFKKDDYTGGIKAAITKLMSTLGTMTWQDRKAAAEKRKQAEDRRKAEMFDTFLNITAIIALLVFLYLLVRFVMKAIDKATQRKLVRRLIKSVRTEITQGHEALDKACIGLNNGAKWVQNEANVFVDKCLQGLLEAASLLNQSESYLKKDYMQADALARESSMLVAKASKTFQKFNENLRAKVQKFKTEGPTKLKVAKKEISQNMGIIQDYIQKGYLFASFLKEQEDLSLILKNYEENISNLELSPKIYTDSEIIHDKSVAIVDQIMEILNQQSIIDKKLDPLVTEARALYQEWDEATKLISSYKAKYPKEVWQELNEKIKKVPEKFSQENLTTEYASIQQLNSMQKQKFQSAFVKYTALETFVNDVKQAYEDLKKIDSAQMKSQQGYPSAINKAEEKVKKALNATKDPDVSKETSNSAKATALQLRNIKIDAKKSIVDWVGIILLLITIVNDSNSIIETANSEISNASTARKNKAIADAQAKSNKSDDNNYSRTYVTSPTSNNNDSGFGGLSGGGFGGGGASGTW